MNPMETYCLSAICMLKRPRLIFEIGTFDGATTARLAASSPEVEVVTLDLPDLESEVQKQAAESGEPSLGVGFRYRDTLGAARIRQLFGDSRTFDFGPWYGKADLVLIDGGHDYDTVLSDSSNAVRMLAPAGTIVWDDYGPTWPDVGRAIDDAAAMFGLPVVRVAGTELAPHTT